MNNFFNAAADFEPVFYFGLGKNSQVPEDFTSVQLKNYFEYRLKQNPNDLSCHLQRIQFALNEKKNNELFAALCDLFIILGDLGQPLRQRLFHLSKIKLDQHQAQLLLSHMREHQLGNDLPDLPGNCLFKKRKMALIKFGERSTVAPNETEDIFQTIDSFIENSQFDIALTYMTDYLEQDNDNEQLTLKLIDLYKSLNKVDEFQKAYDQFANNLLTSQYWDNARQFFLDQP